jgi:hypothetical protein
MDELRRIIEDSEVMAEDDALWPQPGIHLNFLPSFFTRLTNTR